MEKKKEAVSRRQRRRGVKKVTVKMDSSDSEDADMPEDVDELLDWRSKKV